MELIKSQNLFENFNFIDTASNLIIIKNNIFYIKKVNN